MKTLDLGCGNNKHPGSIGIDISQDSDADVFCDLNRPPYPFENDTFDALISKQVLEHLDDVEAVFKEIRRICKNGSKVTIEVPHFSWYLAYADPTHKRSFSIFGFDKIAKKYGFNLVMRKISFHRAIRRYGLNLLFNRFPLWYERFWTYMFPAEFLHFEFEVIK